MHPVYEDGWSLADADYLLSKVVAVKNGGGELVGLGQVGKIEQSIMNDYMLIFLALPTQVWVRLEVLPTYTIKVLEDL